MTSATCITPKPVGVLPRVQVLLASYNGEPWLREQLESILSQEDVEVHVEIGDDCSRDGTRALIKSTWGNDPRVRLNEWSQSSGSAGANFRRLYRHVDATGFDFVALADQDDVWMPRKILSAIQSLQATGAQGYSCAVQAFWPDGRERVLAQRENLRAADFLFEGAGQGCTFVMTSDLFRRIRQFCTDHTTATEALHYHDWLIYLLVRAWQMPWHFDAQPWMRYRQHGGNEIGSRGSLGAIRRRLAMIRNGWFGRQVVASGEIYRLAGGNDPVACALIARVQNRVPSLAYRLALSVQVLRFGRRRFADRLVLAGSALLGWLL
ncbi:glycosyltransferase [Sphaerotilus sp.]|uniref:glycosyltransferase n=1 Tax=Sphaerotilus sp. TaxID=2093942 RepID=UPI00286E2BA0|nr:glycosyltransferase [Sphaerotilus sp.]